MLPAAVLTCDIVHSTRLTVSEENKLIQILKRLLEPYIYEFYRGDSFQVYIKDAEEALQTALLCRVAAICLKRNKAFSPDVRISIGISKTKPPLKAPGTARGEAFVLSGRSFDQMTKSNSRLVISTTHSLANTGLQVVADYINAIFKVMTAKQASVIFELLKGSTQQRVAVKLKKSKSTISQHVRAGRWLEIEKLLQQYQQIVHQLK